MSHFKEHEFAYINIPGIPGGHRHHLRWRFLQSPGRYGAIVSTKMGDYLAVELLPRVHKRCWIDAPSPHVCTSNGHNMNIKKKGYQIHYSKHLLQDQHKQGGYFGSFLSLACTGNKTSTRADILILARGWMASSSLIHLPSVLFCVWMFVFLRI